MVFFFFYDRRLPLFSILPKSPVIFSRCLFGENPEETIGPAAAVTASCRRLFFFNDVFVLFFVARSVGTFLSI